MGRRHQSLCLSIRHYGQRMIAQEGKKEVAREGESLEGEKEEAVGTNLMFWFQRTSYLVLGWVSRLLSTDSKPGDGKLSHTLWFNVDNGQPSSSPTNLGSPLLGTRCIVV